MIKNFSSMSSMSQGLSFLDLNQISEADELLLSQVLASRGSCDLLPPDCRSALHQVENYEDITTPNQIEEEDGGEVEEGEEQPLCPQQLPGSAEDSSSLGHDVNSEVLTDQQEGQAVVQDECGSTYSQPDDAKAAQGHCIPKGYGDGTEESPGPIQTSTQIADTPNTPSMPSALTPGALGSEFTPAQFGTGPAPFHPTSVVPVSHLSSHPTSHAGSFPLAQGGTNPSGMSPSPHSPPIHFTPNVPPPPTPNQHHMYSMMPPPGPTVFVQNMTANVNVSPYSAHQAVAQPQVAGMNPNYMQPEAHPIHIPSNKLGSEVKPDLGKHRDNITTRQPYRHRRGHGKGGRRHDPDRTQAPSGDHSGYGGDKHEGLMCQPPYHGMGGPSLPYPQGMFQHAYMQRSSIVNMPPVQAAQGQPLVYSHSAAPYPVPPQYPPHNYHGQMPIMQFHHPPIPHPHQPHHHQPPHHPPQPLPQPPPQPPPPTASLHPQVNQVSPPSPAPIPSPAPAVTPVSTHPPTPTPCPVPPPPVPALASTCAQESEVEMQGVEPESRQSDMECEVVCEVAPPVSANPSPTVTSSSSPAKSKADAPSPPCAPPPPPPPKNDALAKIISSLTLDNLQPQLSVSLGIPNIGGDYSISFIDASEPLVLESTDDCTEGTSAQSDEQIAESPAQFSAPIVSEVKAVPNGSLESPGTAGEPELAVPAEIKPAAVPAPEAAVHTTMVIPTPPVVVANEPLNHVVPEPNSTGEEVNTVLSKVVPSEPVKACIAMKTMSEEVKVDIPVEEDLILTENKVEEAKNSPQQSGIGTMKEEVPEVTPVPPGGAWAQKKSWSQLFKSPDGAPQKQVALVAPFKAEPVKLSAEEFPAGPSGTVGAALGQEPKLPEPLPIAQEDMDKAKIGAMLREYKHDHHQVGLQPRGLINKGYWCYVNAPLQALLACPPFYNLMKNIPTPPIPKHGPSSTPVIDSVMTFVNEFNLMAPVLKAGRKDKAAGGGRKDPEVVPGAPFEPAYVYKMLANINSELFAEGHQQDAEEMLSCVLNGLHDEMVEALKLAGGSDTCSSNGTLNGDQAFEAEEEEEEVEDEWKVMGPRKRSCVTRTAHFSPSPISAIFWGQLRSILHQAGGHTTANLQPFTTLPLDIQSPRVESVRDALEQLVSREEITGYTCSKTHQEVAVSKQVMLEHLPQVLVLHLKRFIYDKDGGLQKVTKKVNFPIDLEIGKELMSSNSRGKFSTTQRRKYKLLAVVYHDGKEATKGHYVADVFHGGYSCWLRYDDNQVKQVREADVLHHATPRVPYLLFYRRGDTMVGPSTRTK